MFRKEKGKVMYMHKSKLPKHTNNVERVELIIEEEMVIAN